MMHDYQKLGLKVGLEIHQQLEGKKLFCSCPTLLREDQPHFSVQRKLRAVVGESGQIDTAAEQEQEKEKVFSYQGYTDTTCIVELDEEPPHLVNQNALYTTLQLCKLLKAEVSSVVQFMRKTVVDGSNTSGFQRTALVARNGSLETNAGKVSISWINLEEDACKIVSDIQENKNNVKENNVKEKIYRLDRLGIPLIEIGTGPEIHSPEQAQETAKKLGMLLRSLSGVKRGLGTIRQDVNISISGGNRVEIKGAQDLQQLPLLVELEVKRQKELLQIKKELQGTRLTASEIIDLTTLLNDCPSKIIQNTLQKGGKILAIKLNGFAGFVGRELQPNYRLGTEFSGRAKIKAGVGGIFHSDELPNYGITDTDVIRIKKKCKCDEKDAFILVADQEQKAQRALHAVYERAQEVMEGVPKEVRKANADGSTAYLRPMPGAARMYPETDVPLIKPDLAPVQIPETLEEKIIRYQEKLGLSADLAVFIARSEKVALFEELIQKYPQNLFPLMKPAFIAETLTSRLLEIKRNYQEDPEKLTDDNFREVFHLLQENKIHKDIVLDVLIDMIRGKFNPEYYARMGTEKIHDVIKEIVAQNKSAPFPALMGLAMKQLKGKASGEFIAEHLKKVMNEGHG
ncbi:Glu-tRNA(Gln) amidotransferase subunit GatE [Candidatus Woesearchaeota archaeon]|nr:Glu-tRNA(Gln) amidotransferase subunit GatE [Candidatus Woesearchaeota archaeon]